MNKRDHKRLEKRKGSLKRRLRRRNYSEQSQPMMKQENIVYEMGDRVKAAGYGGIGAIHKMVGKLGLAEAINGRVKVLKAHLPYHESDHVLNIAYNVICGGQCLEDLERLRNDETYMNSVGAERIPDPTTAGDFARRFDAEALLQLMEAINDCRLRVWAQQDEAFHEEAEIDIDGTIAPTTGECKQGMGLSYKGIWGYAPLIVTLAKTKEVLYMVNRPGNHTSSMGAAEWIDRTIDLVGAVFKKIHLRGDTDFSLTEHLDRWSEKVTFTFGFNAYKGLILRADKLPENQWEALERPARYEVKTAARQPRENVKAAIVKEREYKNYRLQSEAVAEFEYRPTRCKKTYRMVVVRKNLSVERGQNRLFDEIRYFFYITNDWARTAAEVVQSANQRCDQENVIGQLKSGISAMRMPCDNLLSNWTYMLMGTLAWNLKAWYGLLVEDDNASQDIVRMEFKRFLANFIQIPCQILRTGRRLVYRILAYNSSLETFLRTFARFKTVTFT